MAACLPLMGGKPMGIEHLLLVFLLAIVYAGLALIK